MLQKLKAHAGLVFGLALSIYSLIRVTLETPISSHYHLFVAAGKFLWQGLDPYEHDFQAVGYWFYSQAMGMFFYTPFGLLPDRLGLFLHMGIGIALFWKSLAVFLSHFFPGRDHRLIHAAISIPVFQAVINSKPELYLFAALLFIFTEWALGRFLISSVLAGIIVATKFQPLPFLGLALIPIILRSRRILPPVLALFSGLGFHFLPALFLGLDRFSEFNRHQGSSLAAFMEKAYLDFDNFFHSLASVGWELSFLSATFLSLGFALLFGIITLIHTLRGTESSKVIALAGALASVYAFCFSPLGQNNASILAGFWVCFSCVLIQDAPSLIKKTLFSCMLFLFLFAYSSILPQFASVWLRTHSIKAWILLLSLGWILHAQWKSLPRQRQT